MTCSLPDDHRHALPIRRSGDFRMHLPKQVSLPTLGDQIGSSVIE
jgi:hypothetical protein